MQSATRLLLSLEYYFGENGVLPNATLMIPQMTDSRFPPSFLEVFGIEMVLHVNVMS